MAQFDVAAARQAGYSDDEIMQHLAGTSQFDVGGALKAGHSKADIVDYLSQHAAPPAAGGTGAPLPPTAFDNFVTGATGDPLRPGGDPVMQTIHGLVSSLGRTTQAWHDMFTGNASPTTAAEMVPLIGPAAVDAGRMLATPGQRMQGLGAAAAIDAPSIMHGAPYEMPEMPSIPGAGVVRKAGRALNAATSPEVMSELPGGKTILKTKQAFKDKYNSLQPPPTLGPVPVIRNAESPAWAKNPSPVQAPPAPFEPIPAVQTPSGRVPGPAPATPSAPPTGPLTSIGRVPLWKQSGIQDSPRIPPPPVDPIAPVAPAASAPPIPAPPVPQALAPSPAATPSPTGSGGGLNTTAIQGHELSTVNKIRNLGDYLISKGGDTSHLEQIVGDPKLTRQYLDEAKQYGASQGNPVPKGAYKGLDVEAHPDSTYQRLRSYIMDKINEAKSGQ